MLMKYLMETLAVAAAAFMLLKNQQEALTIGLIAGATFFVLDYFVPSVGDIARKGVGVGFGLMMVGGDGQTGGNCQTAGQTGGNCQMGGGDGDPKFVPTCPDPNNSGQSLLAGYDERVLPSNNTMVQTPWPFDASQPIAYGSCSK